MKKYFAFAAIACAALVSCQKEMGPAEEMPVAPNREGYVELTLSAQCDAETKAILDGNTVVWSVGDEVAVYAGDATTPEKFTVSAVDFDAVKFTGSVPAGATSFIAVYPFSQAKGREGNVIDMVISENQDIPAGGSVCPEALSSVAYFADATAKPQFKNTFSLIQISFSNAGVIMASAISDCSGEGAVGEMKVTVSTTGEAPEIVNCLGGFSATIRPESSFTVGRSYFIVVPPTPEVKSFSIMAYTDTKAADRRKTESFSLPRNKGIDVGDSMKDAKWRYAWIKTADELIDFLSEADDTELYFGPTDVRLEADIDLSGKVVTPAKAWEARFDGDGHSIKNWNASNALFATNAGCISGLKIDSSCSINWTDPIEDMTGIAFIVAKGNSGYIGYCEVAGSITVSTAEAGRIYCAGVVGESTTGTVENCKFTGSIDVTLSGTSASCSAIAGVAGRVGTKDMTDVSIVKDCTNEGSINFLFSGPSGNMKKFGVGGVVGQTPSVANAPDDHGTIEGCVNKGTITWEYTNGGSGSYPCMGGVAGIIEGKIKDCTNNGTITYKGSKVTASTDPNFGGVAGYVTRGASNCINNGQIVLDAGLAGGTAGAQSGGNIKYVQIGGVFGGFGEFITDNSIDYDKFASTKGNGIKMENCVNNATLTLTPCMVQSGGPKMCFGGVVGALTADMENCHNNADVSVTSNTRWIFAGGLAGLANGNVTDCTSVGTLTVDADKDNHPSAVAKQQHYIGGLFGYVVKTSEITNCQNSKPVSLSNVYTTPGSLSYLGGILGGYSGSQLVMTNCSNSGDVTFDADDPICLGGIGGGFNGVMTGTSNSGKVENKSSYTASGKEAEVGGLVGYANATFTGCSNSGAVVSASPDGATGGFVGGFGEAEKTWSDCLSDAPVSGPNAGSIFGWFRQDTEHTITLGAPGAPFTVSANATVNSAEPTFDNIVGKIKNGHTDNVNLIVAGKKEVSFSEDLDNNKFTYDGVEYPVVKLADGRWWMAKNLAFLPAGMTPATDLTAVTAGVFAPIKVTGEVVGFSTDPDLVASNGYLYQAEAAFGLQVGDLTSQAQAEAMEGTQGICPPGWYIPTLTDIMSLVGKTAGVADNSSAPYFGRGLAALNADGFNVEAVGAITIQDNTKTAGTFMGQLSGYTTRLSSSMILGSSLARVTYNTSGDASSGVKNMQFYGLMPMTNKPTEADYTCNGTMISYRIAGPLRCIRKP